jgi:predicted NBD/HSP70 family sugar kinase
VVGDLLAEGVVREVGLVESDGGRPSQVLRLNPACGYVVGVDVGETMIRTEAFDLGMRMLAAAAAPLPDGPIPGEVATAITATVQQVRTDAGRPPGRFLGVGIGVPGLVQQGDEVLVHAQTIGWQAVPLGTLLGSSLEWPVLIDNGAKTLGQAEMWFGAGRGVSSAFVALLGTGVGACIITDGAIYRGATSSAGEWGHTVIYMHGLRCRCGGAGCLEAYVGAEAIAARYAAARSQPMPAGVDVETAVRNLVTGAWQDPAAASVLAETVHLIGIGIANLVNIFDPELVVLGGWVGCLLAQHQLGAVRDATSRYALRRPLHQTAIRAAQLGEDAVAMGAATLPIGRWLTAGGEPPHAPHSLPIEAIRC